MRRCHCLPLKFKNLQFGWNVKWIVYLISFLFPFFFTIIFHNIRVPLDYGLLVKWIEGTLPYMMLRAIVIRSVLKLGLRGLVLSGLLIDGHGLVLHIKRHSDIASPHHLFEDVCIHSWLCLDLNNAATRTNQRSLQTWCSVCTSGASLITPHRWGSCPIFEAGEAVIKEESTNNYAGYYYDSCKYNLSRQ